MAWIVPLFPGSSEYRRFYKVDYTIDLDNTQRYPNIGLAGWYIRANVTHRIASHRIVEQRLMQ
jgi:hypothetical protein